MLYYLIDNGNLNLNACASFEWTESSIDNDTLFTVFKFLKQWFNTMNGFDKAFECKSYVVYKNLRDYR